MRGLLGITVFIGLAWLFSNNRKAIRWKMVGVGIALQFIIAIVLLKIPFIQELFFKLNSLVLILEEATKSGSAYMFGYLGGAPLPFEQLENANSYIIAFRVLPIVLVMSALSALLFHWGILQKFVEGFAWILRRTMHTSGAMGLGVAANIFLGIIEAPVLILPYLAKMARSELFTVMVAGMSTVAGTVMILYASVINGVIDNAIGHIIIASLISAPACVIIAQMLIPMTEEPLDAVLHRGEQAHGAIDALVKGTADGVNMVLNITGVIVVLFAVVYLINQVVGLLPDIAGEAASMQSLSAYVFAPFCWLMGIPWSEALVAAKLMATKTILNEFVAYLELGQMDVETLSNSTKLILTYAMCGFANFGSLGILAGGLGAIIPERRAEIVELGLRAIAAGTMSTMMTGCVISLLI